MPAKNSPALADTLPMEREVTITRIFDAPRAAIWHAWTDPDEAAAWWHPEGVVTPRDSVELDVRPGGSYRYTMIDPKGGKYPTGGVYHEVVEPERLVFGAATVTFTDLGDGRSEMVFHTTVDMPDDVLRTATGGLSTAFDRLTHHLERRT